VGVPVIGGGHDGMDSLYWLSYPVATNLGICLTDADTEKCAFKICFGLMCTNIYSLMALKKSILTNVTSAFKVY
jgi:hypothetical protein